jgi:hypothetical protein
MHPFACRSRVFGGLSVALLLAAFSPAAHAGDTAAAPSSVAGCAYDFLFGTAARAGTAGAICPITLDEGMHVTVSSRHVIRKTSGGLTTTVIVATTSSRPYSTDAIFSRFVQYRGIHVERARG